MSEPTHYRAPNGRVLHLLADSRTTRCGMPAHLGAKFSMSDLPSGERTRYRTCEFCRPIRLVPRAEV